MYVTASCVQPIIVHIQPYAPSSSPVDFLARQNKCTLKCYNRKAMLVYSYDTYPRPTFVPVKRRERIVPFRQAPRRALPLNELAHRSFHELAFCLPDCPWTQRMKAPCRLQTLGHGILLRFEQLEEADICQFIQHLKITTYTRTGGLGVGVRTGTRVLVHSSTQSAR